MNTNQRIYCAIVAILSESAALAAHAQVSSPLPSTDSTTEIPRGRRDGSTARGIHAGRPITLQALTAQTLTQLNVQTFDDFIKFLPNVFCLRTGRGRAIST